jgi:hypothetical protein
MVVEAGEHELKDGTIVQAGTVQGNGKYQVVNFTAEVEEEDYWMPPVVFTQITT